MHPSRLSVDLQFQGHPLLHSPWSSSEMHTRSVRCTTGTETRDETKSLYRYRDSGRDKITLPIQVPVSVPRYRYLGTDTGPMPEYARGRHRDLTLITSSFRAIRQFWCSSQEHDSPRPCTPCRPVLSTSPSTRSCRASLSRGKAAPTSRCSKP